MLIVIINSAASGIVFCFFQLLSISGISQLLIGCCSQSSSRLTYKKYFKSVVNCLQITRLRRFLNVLNLLKITKNNFVQDFNKDLLFKNLQSQILFYFKNIFNFLLKSHMKIRVQVFDHIVLLMKSSKIICLY